MDLKLIDLHLVPWQLEGLQPTRKIMSQQLAFSVSLFTSPFIGASLTLLIDSSIFSLAN